MEIIFKGLWGILVLLALYCWLWLDLILFLMEDYYNNKVNLYLTIGGNLITVFLILKYSKELFLGYKKKSRNKEIKSFVLHVLLIIGLLTIQYHQLLGFFKESKNLYVGIVFLVITVSYIGILVHRVQALCAMK